MDDVRVYGRPLSTGEIFALAYPERPWLPTNLTATAISTNQINLGWSDNATNETGFKLERKTGAGGSYALLAALPANSTNHSDTTAKPGTTYFYRLSATNAAGASAYCDEAGATTVGFGLPAITTHPQSQTNFVGATVTLSVTASGTPPLFYQWFRNASLMPDATNSAFSLQPLALSDAGNYYAIVTNNYGSATSQVAVVAVNFKPGTINAAATTWTGGAAYDWQINRADSAEGADPGWDLLNLSGTLTLNVSGNQQVRHQPANSNLGEHGRDHGQTSTPNRIILGRSPARPAGSSDLTRASLTWTRRISGTTSRVACSR